MRQGYFLLLLVAAVFAAGCGSPCGKVCERWSDCVGLVGTIDACADECSAKADNDSVYSAHVDNCLSCSDALECSEAAQKCAVDCTIAILR